MASTTALAAAEFGSIPIFKTMRPSGSGPLPRVAPSAPRTALRRASPSRASTPTTPADDCSVQAVGTSRTVAPSARAVTKSRTTPAPPLGSKPPIATTTTGGRGSGGGGVGWGAPET